jgi:hypothetical protein
MRVRWTTIAAAADLSRIIERIREDKPIAAQTNSENDLHDNCRLARTSLSRPPRSGAGRP